MMIEWENLDNLFLAWRVSRFCDYIRKEKQLQWNHSLCWMGKILVKPNLGKAAHEGCLLFDH